MKVVVTGFEGWQNKISKKKIWGPIFTPPQFLNELMDQW